MMVDTSIYQALCDDGWYINIPSSLWWWLIHQYTKLSVMMVDTSIYQALCDDGWSINIPSSLWWWLIHQYTKLSVMIADPSIYQALCDDGQYINIPSSLWWWLIHQYTKLSVMMVDTSIYQALCDDGWYINIPSSLWWWLIHQYTKLSVMMADTSIYQALCDDGWYINIPSSLWWWLIHQYTKLSVMMVDTSIYQALCDDGQYTKFSVMMVDISIYQVLCNDNKNNCYIVLYHVTIYELVAHTVDTSMYQVQKSSTVQKESFFRIWTLGQPNKHWSSHTLWCKSKCSWQQRQFIALFLCLCFVHGVAVQFRIQDSEKSVPQQIPDHPSPWEWCHFNINDMQTCWAKATNKSLITHPLGNDATSTSMTCRLDGQGPQTNPWSPIPLGMMPLQHQWHADLMGKSHKQIPAHPSPWEWCHFGPVGWPPSSSTSGSAWSAEWLTHDGCWCRFERHW